MDEQRQMVDLRVWQEGDVWRFVLYEKAFEGGRFVAKHKVADGAAEDPYELLEEAHSEALKLAEEVMRGG